MKQKQNVKKIDMKKNNFPSKEQEVIVMSERRTG